jgi:hypothetical protein
MSDRSWAIALVLLVLAGSALAALPEVAAPNFVSPDAVTDSVSTMIDRLKPASEGGDRSWQAIRARSMCETVRLELRQAQRSRSYTAETAERRWRECADAYARVP